MGKSLSEIYADLREAEYQEKLASLKTAWEGEDEKVDLLSEAIEHIKEAQTAGQLPKVLDQAQMLDLGVTLVEDYLASLEKAAEETPEETPEASQGAAAATEETPEAAEEVEEIDEAEQVKIAEEMGAFTGAFLSENGITVEDLQKIASEEEAVELAEACADAYVAWLSSQDE